MWTTVAVMVTSAATSQTSQISLPVDVVIRSVRALARAARFDEARALAGGGDDPRLAVVLADVELGARYVTGTGGGVSAALDAAVSAVSSGGVGDEGSAWDVEFLLLRDSYARELFAPGTELASPEGRDPAHVDALRDRATGLRDGAPDDRRRGWAEFYLGTIHDNLYGAREVAPPHLRAALDAAEATGDDYLSFEALRHLGDHARDDGDTATAREMWERSAWHAARAGGVTQVLAQLLLLALLARDRGDEAGAALLAEEAARWAQAIGAGRLADEARAMSSIS